MKKIDIFNHIWPQKFYDKVQEVAPHLKDMGNRVRSVPMITDLDERFRVMDLFGEDYAQVLSLSSPPIEVLGGKEHAMELAKIGNDGMAELVAKYPDRFPGFIASLPMDNQEDYMAEARRSIDELGAYGVQIYTNVHGRSMDEPEFFQLYELMAKYTNRSGFIRPVCQVLPIIKQKIIPSMKSGGRWAGLMKLRSPCHDWSFQRYSTDSRILKSSPIMAEV